jgi:hypothetical protein
LRPSHRADGEQHGDLDPSSDRESANDVGAGSHQVSEVTIRLAERFGYVRDELLNSRDLARVAGNSPTSRHLA